MELPALVIAFLIIVGLIFMPSIRRLIVALIRVALLVIGFAGAAAGIAMLMNNETIFEKPGVQQRVRRFLTMNSAAASSSGDGSVLCTMGAKPAAQPEPTATPTPAAETRRRPAKKKAPKESAETAKAAQSQRNAQPVATPAPLDNVFPELIRRSYPGLSRQKLYQLSKETVDSLAGWKVVKADPRDFTLDCIYTTRIFGFQDDVRISISPSGEIDVCSRSGTARPDSTSMLRYFPGDLGANIGHIKEFYEVLEPKMDLVYKEEQDKENAKKPH